MNPRHFFDVAFPKNMFEHLPHNIWCHLPTLSLSQRSSVSQTLPALDFALYLEKSFRLRNVQVKKKRVISSPPHFVEMISHDSWLKSPRSPEGTLSKGEIFSRSTFLLEERVLSHLAEEGCQLHLNLTRVDNEDLTRRNVASWQGGVGRLGDL